VDRHGDKISIQNGIGDEHNGKTSDNAVKGKKTVADIFDLVPRNDRGKYRYIDRYGTKLEGKDLEAVIAVKFKPEKLLEYFTSEQDQRKDPNHDTVCFGIVLSRYDQTDCNAGDNHDAYPKQMEPAVSTGTDITVVDVTPCPINHFFHRITPHNSILSINTRIDNGLILLYHILIE
jgi:hypothetical protein